jgi:hypothetical protein
LPSGFEISNFKLSSSAILSLDWTSANPAKFCYFHTCPKKNNSGQQTLISFGTPIVYAAIFLGRTDSSKATRNWQDCSILRVWVIED